jgi:hypothetical protein
MTAGSERDSLKISSPTRHRAKADFDHCYTPDPKHRFLERLTRAGFLPSEKITVHPGKQICRLIPFATLGNKTRQYLEFVSRPRESRKPGLSFGTGGKLDAYFKTIRANRLLRPFFVHRNYDWKASGPRERRLGWNFIQFRRQFPGTEMWFTEYERPGGKKPVWDKKPRHANGCLAIIGLHFEVNSSGRRYLEAILGGKINDGIRLECGTELAITAARKNRFRFVVLKTSSLKKFCTRARPDRIVDYQGRPAAIFTNPSGAWDLLVV